ncbi:CRPV-247 [Crowpox virus]|nr:CRPV-247 [Crowpox virus]
MDLDNTNQVIYCKEYIHNITNFITIKYNIHKVIVKNKNESPTTKNRF